MDQGNGDKLEYFSASKAELIEQLRPRLSEKTLEIALFSLNINL